MPGLVPGIHVLLHLAEKTWMAGTSPAMTRTASYLQKARESCSCFWVRHSHRLLVIRHRRGDHQKHQIDQPGIRDRVFDAGRQEDEVVLAYHMVLARNLHQPLAFEHVIDLLLHEMLVARDMRHRLVHSDPVVDGTGA